MQKITVPTDKCSLQPAHAVSIYSQLNCLTPSDRYFEFTCKF